MDHDRDSDDVVDLSGDRLQEDDLRIASSLHEAIPPRRVSSSDVRALVDGSVRGAARRRARRRIAVPTLLVAGAAVTTTAVLGVTSFIDSSQAVAPAGPSAVSTSTDAVQPYLTLAEVQAVIPAAGVPLPDGALSTRAVPAGPPQDACGRAGLTQAVQPIAARQGTWAGSAAAAVGDDGAAVAPLSITVSTYADAQAAVASTRALQVSAGSCKPRTGTQGPYPLTSVLLQQFASGPAADAATGVLDGSATIGVDAGAVFTTGYNMDQRTSAMTVVAVSGRYAVTLEGQVPAAMNSAALNTAGTKLSQLAKLAVSRAASGE